MSFAAPLGLLALLAVPVVLALHFFRRRLRPRRVAALFLFPREELSAAAGRTRTRLLRSASLAFELAAAVLLALWLAGASCGARAVQRHVVVVLDDSASMGARGAGASVAEKARAAVAEALRSDGGADVATLVLTGPRPEIAFGPRAPADGVGAALAAFAPAKSRHDPAPALDLGLQLAEPGDRLVFVTDEPGLAAPARYERRSVGEPLTNAAIAAARRAFVAGDDTLFVDLRAFGGGPAKARVRVIAADGAASAVLAEQTVELEPSRVAHVSARLPPATGAVSVRLDDDALALDNAAILLPEPRRVVGVASLLADEAARVMRLDSALAAIDGVERGAPLASAALVVSGSPGSLAPGVVELVVAPAGDGRAEWVGPFLLDRRHPLLSGVTLDGVVWSAGEGDVAGVPLATASSRPLVTEIVDGSAARVTLNLDPARSNFARSPDWPILLANVVERARSGLPGAAAANVRLGDEILWRHAGDPKDAAELELVGPGGEARRGRGVREIGFAARELGIHRLRRGAEELGRFSVRFEDANESDLTRCGAGRVAAQAAAAGVATAAPERPGRVEGRWLATLALLAVVGDWVVLRRRAAP